METVTTTLTTSTSRASNRTDIHRVGALCPEDYAFVLAYARPMMADGWPIPGFNINCELERTFDKDGKLTHQKQHSPDGLCCIIGLRYIAKVTWAPYGGTCKCTACGTHFGTGAVYRHRATGEHIHLGHTCADKFEFVMEDAHFEETIEKLRAMGMAARVKKAEAEARDRLLDHYPGLREAFSECSHRIVREIAARFSEYGSKTYLSDKQVALCLKLHRDQKEPNLATAEKHVAAPEGRVDVRGRIVSVRAQESSYSGGYGRGDGSGVFFKMTVKVETPEGSWLCWGTVPSSIEGRRADTERALKGKVVEFRATLKHGREPHFAIFSRPTGASIVDETAQPEAKAS